MNGTSKFRTVKSSSRRGGGSPKRLKGKFKAKQKQSGLRGGGGGGGGVKSKNFCGVMDTFWKKILHEPRFWILEKTK